MRISIIKPLQNSQSLHLLRWERYAPGPVREITVAKAKVKAEPKRGRKRKTPEVPEEEVDDPTVRDGVFSAKSTNGLAVPPEAPSEIPNLSNVPEESEVDTTPIPTRATFAGRIRKGSVQHQLDFDARRTKFYEWVPSSFWKDHLEQEFWAKCVESENMEVAIKSFLIDLGFDPSKIKPRTAAAEVQKAKAKANAKSKATAEKPKNPGRGRARGRGRGRGKSAVCRG